MKNKRQTVWLVSMLSLMVVLSAYYLFTEDTPNANKTADGGQVTTMDGGGMNGISGSAGDAATGDEVILSEIVSEDGQNAVVTDEGKEGAAENPGTAENAGTAEQQAGKEPNKEESANPTEGQTGEEASNKDDEVLKQLESSGVAASDSITSYQLERVEQNNQKQDDLMQTINDNSKPLDEAVMAQKQLNELQEKEEIIYGIEEKLQQKYANAVVREEDNKFKVLVESEKLEANEAVSIMDLVIKELGVSQDKVSVQYITN